ncbi:hypothetical protein L1987_02118 [Smallanthus sonchifolius]|uniref:Uncharacterized protein n=1 Tax=Smallanthus sonchifolius TaxID=185202 RepID=A0ACB9K712_9ASTR|nr:hypothetical protein L1987_02118 [Smallanthus sonchifolius]
MPENGAKSHLVNNGKALQSVDPFQSAWLTHWTGPRSETVEHDHLAQLNGSKENDLNDHDFKNHLTGIEISSDNFGFSKDVDLTTRKPSSQSFQFFKRGQESGKRSVLDERVQALGLGRQVSHEKSTSGLNVETSSRECHLQPTDQVKHHMFFSESSYLSSRPSDQVVYKLDSHTTHGPQNFRHLTDAFASKEQLPKSEKSEMPSFEALLKTDPSTSNYRSLALIEEQYKKMQKHIATGFFPHSKPQTVHHEQSSSQNVPRFVHDVEMTNMSGGLHSFSRKTHSLLLTKQTDGKVYQESQLFRESRLSTQLKGVKLQLLDSSDHESQENVEEYRAYEDVQKNESSADTDAMDMESFKENHLFGVHLFPTDKDIAVDSNVEKDKCRKRKIELSDINLEISDQPDASSSAEKPEPCMSRTQSLDMCKLHYNLDQTNSNSNECANSYPRSEPGSRWIKRLKLSEPSSHGKTNRFFTRVMEGKPEPKPDNHHGQKSEILIGESPWIQRWSHKQSQKNPETLETCKLDDSELETDEFQRKQFPSIVAMALMGKTMAGFPQFKLQKKESFVVWDTKVSTSNTGRVTKSVLF